MRHEISQAAKIVSNEESVHLPGRGALAASRPVSDLVWSAKHCAAIVLAAGNPALMSELRFPFASAPEYFPPFGVWYSV